MWHKCNGKAVQYGASLIDSEQENLIVTALWNDRTSWELVTFNCKGTEINDTEVFDKLNHIKFLRPAVVCAYALFPAPLSWHTTLINLALRNPFWLHLRSTATPVCQSFIDQAPDSFPTHLIKVTIAEPAPSRLHFPPQSGRACFSLFWVQTNQFCLEMCASHQLNEVERGDSLLDHR